MNKLICSALLLLSSFAFFACSDSVSPDMPSSPAVGLSAPSKGERIFFIKAATKTYNLGTVAKNFAGSELCSMDPSGADLQQHTRFLDDYYYCTLPQLSYDGKSITFVSNYRFFASRLYNDVFNWNFAGNSLTRISGEEYTPSPAAYRTISVVLNPYQAGIRVSAKGCRNYYITKNYVGEVVTLEVPSGLDSIWVKAETAGGYGDVENLSINQSSIALNTTKIFPPFDGVSPSLNGSYYFAAIYGQINGYSGSKLALSYYNQNNYISFPALSHSGSQAAFVLSQNGILNTLAIATNPTNGSLANSMVVIPPAMIDQNQEILNIAWAPNDSAIVFACGSSLQNNSPVDLYYFNLYTSKLVNLTKFKASNQAAMYPTFSPDGTKIAYSSETGAINSLSAFDYLSYPAGGNIYIMNLSDGTTKQKTTDNSSFYPTWGIVK